MPQVVVSLFRQKFFRPPFTDSCGLAEKLARVRFFLFSHVLISRGTALRLRHCGEMVESPNYCRQQPLGEVAHPESLDAVIANLAWAAGSTRKTERPK